MRIKHEQLASRQEFRPMSAGTPEAWARKQSKKKADAFTLIEVVVATAIVGLVFGGIINCYIQSGLRMEWTGYSQAAPALAGAGLEQATAATWDPAQIPPVNSLTNLNLQGANYNSSTATYTGYNTAILDVPYSGTNFTMATNYITVQLLDGVGGQAQVQMQFVRVDTVWPFFIRGRNVCFTNTVATLMAPDDRQL